jgi:hypothetical protein
MRVKFFFATHIETQHMSEMKRKLSDQLIDTLVDDILIMITRRLEIRDRLKFVATNAALRARRFALMGSLPPGRSWREYDSWITTMRNAACLPVAVIGEVSMFATSGTLFMIDSLEDGDIDLRIVTRNMNIASVSARGDVIAAVSTTGRVHMLTVHSSKLRPFTPPELKHTKILSVSVGGDHIIAMDDTGVVFCYGDNDHGQCGLRMKIEEENYKWRRVPLEEDIRACRVSAGDCYSLVVTEGGQLYAFGAFPGSENTSHHRLVPFPARIIIVSAAAGSDHALALTEGGDVFAWGRNQQGQLGIAGLDTDALQATPTRVFPDSASVCTSCLFSVVAASGNTSGAVTDTGVVYLWGLLHNECFGSPFIEPSVFEMCANEHVTAMSLNSKRMLCVTREGSVIGCNFETHDALKFPRAEGDRIATSAAALARA